MTCLYFTVVVMNVGDYSRNSPLFNGDPLVAMKYMGFILEKYDNNMETHIHSNFISYGMSKIN